MAIDEFMNKWDTFATLRLEASVGKFYLDEYNFDIMMISLLLLVDPSTSVRYR